MSFSLCSVGDVMLGENTHHFGRGIPVCFADKFERLLAEPVLRAINSTDVFFANFECSLISDVERRVAGLERAVYAAPESALGLFDAIRPQVVLNVANNHFGQHGASASEYTIRKLEERGIVCIGKDADSVQMELPGRKLVCWGVNLIKSKNAAATCFEVEPGKLTDAIQWPKKAPDELWIVSIHWGEEYRTLPNREQRQVAEQLSDHGVDLILGHHPHVIQPVEQIGNTTVCYSHGNFIFDQNFSRQTRQGLLCRIAPETGEVEASLTRQRDYVVELQKTAGVWLPQYCKRNDSAWLPVWMRIAMKAELLLNAHGSNRETWGFFSGRLRRKFGV
jgi:hypothetical protein